MGSSRTVLGRGGVDPCVLDRCGITVAVPVSGDDAALGAEWDSAARAGADLIEWRVDARESGALDIGRRLRTTHRLPVLVTARTSIESGDFPHPPGSSPDCAYQHLLLEASQWADAVDVEYLRPGAPDLIRSIRDAGAVPVASFHEFAADFDEEQARLHLRRMADMGAGVAKVAWRVSTPEQAQQVLDTQVWACENLSVPTVVIGMGGEGAATRSGDGARRSAFTFATVLRTTAPGQLTVQQVRETHGPAGNE